jgi:hypothetical protein
MTCGEQSEGPTPKTTHYIIWKKDAEINKHIVGMCREIPG